MPPPPSSDLSPGEWRRTTANEIQEERDPESSVRRDGVNNIYAARLDRLRPSDGAPRLGGVVAIKKRRHHGTRNRLSVKLQALHNPTDPGVDIEPLTLANPVSEILKVCPLLLGLTMTRCVLWRSDSCQLPPGDVRCDLDQRRLGGLSEKDPLRDG